MRKGMRKLGNSLRSGRPVSGMTSDYATLDHGGNGRSANSDAAGAGAGLGARAATGAATRLFGCFSMLANILDAIPRRHGLHALMTASKGYIDFSSKASPPSELCPCPVPKSCLGPPTSRTEQGFLEGASDSRGAVQEPRPD